jgi:membrane dipeptidase
MTFPHPVADLHCDLLAYLQYGGGRTAYDPVLPCAIPYLLKGGVKLQTMAIYTETHEFSVEQGMHQYQLYKLLPSFYPETFTEHISLKLAIENASGICSERCQLAEGLQRLQQMVAEGHKPLYISLTWNSENRFGGGAHTTIGLKDDGRKLLDWMSQHQIAIDLSHTSDALAYDILDHSDRHHLNLTPIASHSNLRTLCDMPRNLPDDLAKEIFNRGGVIGINFVRYFVGKDPDIDFIAHIKQLLRWGGENQICLGADFFYGGDGPPELRKTPEELFFPGYDTSACYPRLQQALLNQGVSEAVIQKILYINLFKEWKGRKPCA